ncbi:MAG: hypothetical protein IPP90_16865 [Gemmatimonadaceae bacterium]|nr:hypothetical protein [Gemmatimonadaceae bacterium]
MLAFALILGVAGKTGAQSIAAPVALAPRRWPVTPSVTPSVPWGGATEADAAVTSVEPFSSIATRRTAVGGRTSAAPWWAPVSSAIVPGSGQFALGQQRSVAYLVAEGYLVLQAHAAQRDGNRDRDEYRVLASDVARRAFATSRPIGTWEYYESMEKFNESGVFDRAPGGAVDPETDQNTYNGSRWRLARETYWRDPDAAPPTSSPEYQRALAVYTAEAVRDEFRWSWRDAQLQRDVYVQTIRSANRSYQRAVNMLGLVGANHLASLIDAYVTVRVRRFGGVRVAGLQFEGVHSSIALTGDPAGAHGQIVSILRFVPSPD